jgi:hypothetical protein
MADYRIEPDGTLVTILSEPRREGQERRSRSQVSVSSSGRGATQQTLFARARPGLEGACMLPSGRTALIF